jgi:hypothetical protein
MAAGVKPLALWSVAELPDLLNEDGTVAPEKVQDAIRTAEESLGLRLGLHVERKGYQPTWMHWSTRSPPSRTPAVWPATSSPAPRAGPSCRS